MVYIFELFYLWINKKKIKIKKVCSYILFALNPPFHLPNNGDSNYLDYSLDIYDNFDENGKKLELKIMSNATPTLFIKF